MMPPENATIIRTTSPDLLGSPSEPLNSPAAWEPFSKQDVGESPSVCRQPPLGTGGYSVLGKFCSSKFWRDTFRANFQRRASKLPTLRMNRPPGPAILWRTPCVVLSGKEKTEGITCARATGGMGYADSAGRAATAVGHPATAVA